MPDGVRARDVGSVHPTDTLGDVLALFASAREWAVEVDEQLHADGKQPMGATLGLPIAQLDAIILILEREQERQLAAAVNARRIVLGSMVWCLACGILGVLNLLSIFAHWGWF